MNINNLFFHIHHCNCRQGNEGEKYSKRISRTLQHHELLFIIRGKGHITVQNKKYHAKESMLLYIPKNVQHSIDIDIEDPFSFLSVHFSYATVNFNDDKWDIRNETDMLPLEPVQVLKDYYQINNVFKKLVESWSDKLPGYEFITKTLLQQLLFEILKNIKKNSRNYSTSLKVEKIIEYMRQHIDNKITLADLSELVQLSSAYLSRVFKETTGYSVIEFFNKIKVDKAKEFIIEGDKKIREIAQILGFTDEFYFSKLFKKIEGISPSEFYDKNVHGY